MIEISNRRINNIKGSVNAIKNIFLDGELYDKSDIKSLRDTIEKDKAILNKNLEQYKSEIKKYKRYLNKLENKNDSIIEKISKITSNL